MEANAVKEKLVSNYWDLIQNLGTDVRIELIAKLANSLKEDFIPHAAQDWRKLYGAWESDQEPEEMILEMRNDRLFNRTRESF